MKKDICLPQHELYDSKTLFELCKQMCSGVNICHINMRILVDPESQSTHHSIFENVERAEWFEPCTQQNS